MITSRRERITHNNTHTNSNLNNSHNTKNVINSVQPKPNLRGKVEGELMRESQTVGLVTETEQPVLQVILPDVGGHSHGGEDVEQPAPLRASSFIVRDLERHLKALLCQMNEEMNKYIAHRSVDGLITRGMNMQMNK